METNTTKNIDTAFAILTALQSMIISICKLTVNDILTDSTFSSEYKEELITEKNATVNAEIRELFSDISKNLVYLGETITALNLNTEIFSDNAVISACDIVSRLDSTKDNKSIIETLTKCFKANFGALLLFYSSAISEHDSEMIQKAILTPEQYGSISDNINSVIVLCDSDVSDYQSVIIGLNKIIKALKTVSNYFGFDFSSNSEVGKISEKAIELEMKQALKI